MPLKVYKEEIILNSFSATRNKIIISMSFLPAVLPGSQCLSPVLQEQPAPTLSFRKSTEANAHTVVVDFSLAQCQAGLGEGEWVGEAGSRAWPVFNDDGLHFTPCFMLQHDKLRTPYNLPAFMALHQTRLEEITEDRTELLVPKPSKGNSFCCVCRSYFDDYLEHVTRPDHVHLMRENKFCGDISGLCGLFGREGGRRRLKEKPIRKEGLRTARRGQVKQLLRSTSTEASSLILGETHS